MPKYYKKRGSALREPRRFNSGVDQGGGLYNTDRLEKVTARFALNVNASLTVPKAHVFMSDSLGTDFRIGGPNS